MKSCLNYVRVGGGDIIKMDVHEIIQFSAGLKITLTLMWYEFWIYMKTRFFWLCEHISTTHRRSGDVNFFKSVFAKKFSSVMHPECSLLSALFCGSWI